MKEIYANKQYKKVGREDYSEAYALDTLMHESSTALVEDTVRFEEGRVDNATFSININGVSIEFILGAPQYAALCQFIIHIAEENLYRVEIDGVYSNL